MTRCQQKGESTSSKNTIGGGRERSTLHLQRLRMGTEERPLLAIHILNSARDLFLRCDQRRVMQGGQLSVVSTVEITNNN